MLLTEYFDSVHWFSIVVVEPKLRSSLDTLRRTDLKSSEKPFLLLLSVMLGLAAWYKAHKTESTDRADHAYWNGQSQLFVANAEAQVVEIMDQRSVTAIQTSILLGSYYVYHGRPNLSFSLLGATIKAAQSIGLHKASPNASPLDTEERKRVWWTIYTWDRFASVNYGRPLGISEEVCSVEQPQDLVEDPTFDGTNPGDHRSLCYSTYQRKLNRLYQLASPAIERLYQAPGHEQGRTARKYHTLASEATTLLWEWRRQLPEHLRLNIDQDWSRLLSVQEKAHKLQSLSLHLTFDSLILVLHRPFINLSLNSALTESSPIQTQDGTRTRTSAGQSSSLLPGHEAPSHEHLWSAAVRTARLTEMPHLAQHAIDSHLVIFMAMNLFNSAVVLVVMALSNPLSDQAQEGKRAVARIHRVLSALGSRSVLSQQSSTVLRDLIQLIITRESDAMLALVTTDTSLTTPQLGNDLTHANGLSVKEALSLPLWLLHNGETEAAMSDTRMDSDHTAHLQLGLESVQRAFVSSGIDVYASQNSTRRQSAVEGDWTEALHCAEPDAQWAQHTAFPDMSDNGMHWIWDPAWDNMFGQMTS